MPTGTWASVTDAPCTCKSLEDDAADPNTPIRYDPELNEYNIVLSWSPDGYGSMRIYHCPFCGGLAPESRRDKLFAVVPDSEHERLRALTAGIGSVEDAVRILGTPSTEEPVTMPSGYVLPRRREDKFSFPVRALTFTGLSDVAEIQVLLHDDKSVQVTIGPKYIGPLKRGV